MFSSRGKLETYKQTASCQAGSIQTYIRTYSTRLYQTQSPERRAECYGQADGQAGNCLTDCWLTTRDSIGRNSPHERTGSGPSQFESSRKRIAAANATNAHSRPEQFDLQYKVSAQKCPSKIGVMLWGQITGRPGRGTCPSKLNSNEETRLKPNY